MKVARSKDKKAPAKKQARGTNAPSLPRKTKNANRATARFGATLRKLRTAKKITLGTLADRLGVSLPYLSDVERGRRDPLSNDRIRVVAEFLEADPMPLLTTAAEARGKVILELSDVSPKMLRVASLLALVWPDISEELATHLTNTLT